VAELNVDELYSIVNEIKTEQVRLSEQLSNYQKLLETVQNVVLAVRDLANAQKNTSDELTRLRNNVDDIKKSPSKTVETTKVVAITVIITGVLQYFITKLLGG
jgi:septal ring factor EnvC (AmiA/AmiB activator)